MIKAERQQEILYLLNAGGVVGVNDLAERFGISALTVRRDLVDLQAQGLLSRTHGGAILDAALRAYGRYEGGSFDERATTHGLRKRRIADRAAKLVADGDSLLINAGSTTTEFARALRNHRNVHVVTNGLTVAMELAKNATASVHVLAGSLEKKKMATVFDPSGNALGDLRAPCAFLGVVSLNTTEGPMMLTAPEAAMTRALVQVAFETTLLVDSSKFQATAMYRVVTLNKITRVITDDALPEADRRRLEAAGVDVLLVAADETEPA